MDNRLKSAEEIIMFCRLNFNTKKDLPIRSSEMGVLYFIWEDGPSEGAAVSPVMLAEFFQVSKPMVTIMISSLCKKGYLIKVPSTTDKRSFNLELTQKGVELVKSAQNEYLKNLEILSNEMGKRNFDQLISLLGKANSILIEGKKV